MKNLKLAIIYPKYINANGDFGNILMLKQRTEINGAEFSYDEIDISDSISLQKHEYDFYYIGGMQDEFNPIVTRCLLENKEEFREIQSKNKTILGVCYGFQILGRHYTFANGEQISGLGLLNSFTIEKNRRHTGNVTSQMTFMTPSYLVGFENHRGSTYLDGHTKPLSYVNIGFGNNGSDKTEGAIYNNTIGTYLTGPFLPRNVYFADYLLKITMENKYQEEFPLVEEADTLEDDVHYDFINAKY